MKLFRSKVYTSLIQWYFVDQMKTSIKALWGKIISINNYSFISCLTSIYRSIHSPLSTWYVQFTFYINRAVMQIDRIPMPVIFYPILTCQAKPGTTWCKSRQLVFRLSPLCHCLPTLPRLVSWLRNTVIQTAWAKRKSSPVCYQPQTVYATARQTPQAAAEY